MASFTETSEKNDEELKLYEFSALEANFLELNNLIENSNENNQEIKELLEKIKSKLNPNEDIIIEFGNNKKLFYVPVKKKYFLKKNYVYYVDRKIKESNIKPTCEIVDTALSDHNDDDEIQIIPISNQYITKEIVNDILEFAIKFFYHPWHSINKPLEEDNFEENIIFKKIIKFEEDGPDKINTLPYWNEHPQYIIFRKKNDTCEPDKIPFWKENLVYREWYADWIMKKDWKYVLELLTVANYMNFRPLLDLCASRISFKAYKKNSEEIRIAFDLPK